MKLNASIQTNIRNRKSVRNYKDQAISLESKSQLLEVMQSLSGDKYRFVMVDSDFSEDVKIGTYGMIRGATAYIVGILKNTYRIDQRTTVEFGADFEKIILLATDLGLGTCWMAGTYNRKDVKKHLDITDDEGVVMVSPVGYAASDGLKEKLTRFIAKSDQRKDWNELFFLYDESTPLTKEEAGDYLEALEMVRLAPSAKNSQPWRIIKRVNQLDFYVVGAKKATSSFQKFNLIYNDLGIAKAHFELTAVASGLHGEWVYSDFSSEVSGDLSLVGSWVF